MDADMGRLARREGCAGCCWFNATGTTGEKTYGHCQVSPPRTSSYNQWPVVEGTKWCSAWLPVTAKLYASFCLPDRCF